MVNLFDKLYEVITDEYKAAIGTMLQEQKITTNAEFILSLCEMIDKKIEIVVKNSYVYQRGKTSMAKEEEQSIMVFATQLIYSLRTFIHNEEITFHMATKSSDGKYQASAFIPQSVILGSLSAVSNKAIGVNLLLQKKLITDNQNNTLFNIKRKNMWNQVEYLAKHIPGPNVHKIDVRKPGAKEPHWAFQSSKKDMMVYISYHENKNYTKYYDMTGQGKRDGLMSFNNGWLWEWYNEILYGGSDEEYLSVTKSLTAYSLRPIMKKKDSIPGTKQGDFQDLQNRQIQSKYNNNKIISYNNIRRIIYELKMSLKDYIAEEKGAEEKLVTVLKTHFFPESADVGNNFANEVINNLLQPLNAKNLTIRNFSV